MKAEREQSASRWLRQAEVDLEDAKYLLEGGRYHLVCFMSQQASEKALKAYLYSQGAETVWGHSSSELCADAGRYDKGFLKLKYLLHCSTHSTFPHGILTLYLQAFQQTLLQSLMQKRLSSRLQKLWNTSGQECRVRVLDLGSPTFHSTLLTLQ